MAVSRVVIFVAAVCFTAASIDAAQGKAGGRPGRTEAPAAKATAQGSAADRPAPAPKPTIAANISKNPQVEARVRTMLPSGMTLEQASEGFRNQGQFIATLQASQNLDIPFADLKAQMTGNKALSLGEAIQKLRPSTR